MRAVNLIPAEARRGAGGAAGQSGGIVYAVLGAFAGLLVMGVLYAVYSHQISDRKQQLVSVTAQAAAAQSQAAQFSPYVQFASLSETRTQALVQLANSRFDWSKAMDQIARALPHGVTLNALSGGAAATPGGAAPAAAAATAATAQPGTATTGPTFSFTGCASSHSVVGAALTRLRSIPGVASVSLASSSKEAGTAATTHAATTQAAATAGASSQPTTSCPFVTFQGSVVYGTDAAVRVTPSNTTGTAPVQVADPPGGAVGAPTGATGSTGASGTAPAPGVTGPAGAATPAPVSGGTSSPQPARAAIRAHGAAVTTAGASK